jgi:stringent starvation protein B
MHEWIVDSSCTPHIVVDASVPGVEVPRQYVQDGKIVLNVSVSATSDLLLGNDEVCFRGRFGGTAMDVRIPVESILAVYARETGQGMIFPEEGTTPPPGGGEPKPPAAPEPKPTASRARLKVVK